MAKVNFNIEVQIINPETFPEIEARLKDLRPVFEDIIEKWARNNKEKFDASVGMEVSGATIDPGVFWEPLTPGTIKSKRKHGFPNQIMVATGDLELALEDSEGFFSEMTPQETAFGTPNVLEDEMKAVFNYEKRPTIFLSLTDQKMIESDVINYISIGENWKEIMFARGLENIKQGKELAQMDMEFNMAAQ